jgi:hypothetical protein
MKANELKLELYKPDWETEYVTSDMQNLIEAHVLAFQQKQDDFILSVYHMQSGFISIEESKDFIQVNKMIQNGQLVGTDYLFNGKCILTIYQVKSSVDINNYNLSFTYKIH